MVKKRRFSNGVEPNNIYELLVGFHSIPYYVTLPSSGAIETLFNSDRVIISDIRLQQFKNTSELPVQNSTGEFHNSPL
jgi:hypothetical protein